MEHVETPSKVIKINALLTNSRFSWPAGKICLIMFALILAFLTILGAYELYLGKRMSINMQYALIIIVAGEAGITNQLHCFDTIPNKGQLVHMFHLFNGGMIFLIDTLLVIAWLCWKHTPQRGDIWRNFRWSTVGIVTVLPFLDIIYTLMTVTIVLVPLYPIWANNNTLCSTETFVTAMVASGVNFFLLLLGGIVCLVVGVSKFMQRRRTIREKARLPVLV